MTTDRRIQCVGRIVGILSGHDPVIGIVAPAEEDADERLVIGEGTLRDGGIDEPQVADGIAQREGADRRARSLAEEVAAGSRFQIFLGVHK